MRLTPKPEPRAVCIVRVYSQSGRPAGPAPSAAGPGAAIAEIIRKTRNSDQRPWADASQAVVRTTHMQRTTINIHLDAVGVYRDRRTLWRAILMGGNLGV